MDMFDRNELMMLAGQKDSPSVTISMPTHVTGTAAQQDPIRLKNLLRVAEDRLVAGGGTMLSIWDVSGRPLRLSGHTADVWDAQWSPDGRRIGTTSYDGTARIWDAMIPALAPGVEWQGVGTSYMESSYRRWSGPSP